jgi:hypothetical protein
VAGNAGSQRAGRAGQGDDHVVAAEQPGAPGRVDGVGQHCLLQRGERAGLHHLGGHGAGQRGQEQRRRPGGDGEHRAGSAHRDQQQPVAAAPPDPVAIAGQQQRGQRGAGQQRAEHQADLGARTARPRQRDADEHAAQPVGERPQRLDPEQPPGVAAQPWLAWVWCWH